MGNETMVRESAVKIARVLLGDPAWDWDWEMEEAVRMEETTVQVEIERTDEQQVETKTCSSCGETKPVTDYFRDKNNKDGWKAKCKACCGHKGGSAVRHAEKTQWECRTCGLVVPTKETKEHFFRDRGSPSGFAYICKNCKRQAENEYRKKKKGLDVTTEASVTAEAKVGALNGRVLVDFGHRTEVLASLVSQAAENERTVEGEIMWILRQSVGHAGSYRSEVKPVGESMEKVTESDIAL